MQKLPTDIRQNGDWIKVMLKSKEGVTAMLIILLVGCIIFLLIENKNLKEIVKLHQKEIDIINRNHATELKKQRSEFKQELLDWKRIVDAMSNQSQEKEDLSRKVVDLTLENQN